ncbi:recombinase family protein [Pelotomaculum propionicicum]|uniref:recombinase family protein n=1 Tax=Pelotomaculum propionicicum TaxID=258475 RepID=UPI003B817E13
MARVIRRISPFTPLLPKKKRVAAYARVSSGKDAMLHSLSAQISYYSDYIQKHREWQYAGVYADEALTGTKDSRAEFQRLLDDCRAGHIDMVITKSISRFARNTVIMLETLRELKLINVDVFFEKENIHSMSGDGELMLTILASFAQAESLSVSENCKWRIRKRFQNGEIVNLRFMYGYNIKKGVITVDEQQAEIVRMIFADYISGLGCSKIANKLNQIGVRTVRNNTWNDKRVADIIKNEKYTGNALLQRKYVTDHLSKKLVLNKGKLPKYYAEGTHDPIIDAATFEKAQEIMAGRRDKNKIKQKTINNYLFTGMIKCPRCGRNYRRVNNNGRVAWNCPTFIKEGKAVCHCKQLPEDILLTLTAEVLGLDDFDENVFREKIKEMIVPEPGQVLYIFHGGHKKKASWQNRSRKFSWTDEAKLNARNRALAYREGVKHCIHQGQ